MLLAHSIPMISPTGFYCAIHASYWISLAMLHECEHELGKAPELLINLASIATAQYAKHKHALRPRLHTISYL